MRTFTIVIYCLLMPCSLMAQKTFSLNPGNKALASVLDEIESQSDLRFYYDRTQIDIVTVSFRQTFSDPKEFLEALEAQYGLHFIIDGRNNVFIHRYPFTRS